MEFQSPINIQAIYGRQAPGDISAAPSNPYPTSPLQQSGFALLIFFPILAFALVVLRICSRFRIRQFGWGMFTIPIILDSIRLSTFTKLVPDDGLIIVAMVRLRLSQSYRIANE